MTKHATLPDGRAEWMDNTHPQGGPKGETAFLVSEKLYGIASYTRLRKNSKKAARRGVRKQETISVGQNYGIYPEGQLLVLDTDVKHAETLEEARVLREEQLDVLEAFLHMPLRETFSVITPTGGVHSYIMLPNGFNFADDAPFFPKLSLNADVSAAINTIVSAAEKGHKRRKLTVDVRRPDIDTYVLGPGSWLPKGTSEGVAGKYLIAYGADGFSPYGIDAPILRIPDDGIRNMKELSDVIEQRSTSNTFRKQREALRQEDVASDMESQYPSTRQVQALRRLIQRYRSFHQQRAAVKAALTCCYTDEIIADVCMELAINRDSSKKKPLSQNATLKDVQRFIVDAPQHGIYCRQPVTKQLNSAYKEKSGDQLDGISLEERFRALAAADIARKKAFPDGDARRRFVNPAVVDMQLARTTLMSTTNRHSMPQRVQDALDILDYYVQPLSNYGVVQIILSRAEIKKTLEMTDSRVSAALRALRETDVLHIDIPPQPGRTTVYTVNTEFFHKDLTWALKKTWGYNNARRQAFGLVDPAALFFDRMSWNFREVFTGEQVISPNTNAVKILKNSAQIQDHPVRETTGAGAALRYIRTEAREHNVEVVPSGETQYILIDKDTGEIVVEDWSTDAVATSMTREEYVARTGYHNPQLEKFRAENEAKRKARIKREADEHAVAEHADSVATDKNVNTVTKNTADTSPNIADSMPGDDSVEDTVDAAQVTSALENVGIMSESTLRDTVQEPTAAHGSDTAGHDDTPGSDQQQRRKSLDMSTLSYEEQREAFMNLGKNEKSLAELRAERAAQAPPEPDVEMTADEARSLENVRNMERTLPEPSIEDDEHVWKKYYDTKRKLQSDIRRRKYLAMTRHMTEDGIMDLLDVDNIDDPE